MIKALFFDLDGTLLTSSRKLSESTKIALKLCRDKGIKIFTATARPPLLTKMLCLTSDEEELIQDGGVFYNGGCICCSNERIYTSIPETAALKCIEVINTYKEVNLAVQMINEIHSFRYGLTDKEYILWGIKNDQLVNFTNLKCHNVVKIVVFSPCSILKDLYNCLMNAVGDMVNVYLTGKGEFQCIEIVDKKINKKQAAEKVVELLGLSHDEVAVFGDDYNDIEMLKGFRNSIAMGNACDEVKACANFITLSNDEEGIHFALKNILNLI